MEDIAQKPLTGRKVFIYLMAFFAVVTVVNVIFITKALQSHSGVVIESPYERGLAYNKILAAHEKQVALGWKGEASLEGDRLVYLLTDKDGAPLDSAKVMARMIRPVQNGYDFDVILFEEKPGRYSAKIDAPLKGAWDARVTVMRGADSFDTMTSLLLK